MHCKVLFNMYLCEKLYYEKTITATADDNQFVINCADPPLYL